MEASNIFYGETATVSAPATPTQAPQPAGLGGSTASGGLAAYTSTNHQALYLVLALVGGAFLLLHLT